MMNNLLKIITSILLLSSSLSFADNMELESHHGFYLAADIGTASLIDQEAEGLPPQAHQLSGIGIIGGGFIGYHHGFSNRCGLDLEFFANTTNATTKLIHIPTYEQKQHYDIGLRLLPDLAFSPMTTMHLILGYVNGKFEIADTGIYGHIDTSFHKSGFQTGLGFTSSLCDNLSVRMDVTYSIYPSQTTIGVGLTPGTIQIYQNRFNTLAGELSLIYQSKVDVC